MSRRAVPVLAAPLESELYTFYGSMQICAECLCLQHSHVSEVCAGKRKQTKGYKIKAAYTGYYEKQRRKAQ